jgi:hypothetical protein
LSLNLEQDRIPDLNIDDVVIDRFGLNYDFINETRLSWIPGLETGSGTTLRLHDLSPFPAPRHRAPEWWFHAFAPPIELLLF